MRNYNEKNKESTKYGPVLKSATVIIVSVAAMLLLTLLAAVIIRHTSVPESSESIIMTVIPALTALGMSMALTKTMTCKPVFAALASFAAMLAFKLVLTDLIEKKVAVTGQGMIGLAFTALFCLLGCLIGANSKK